MVVISDIPVELLAEILTHTLHVSPAEFLRFPNRLSFERHAPAARSAQALLVCKAWYRLGVVSLYENLRIHHPEHVRILATLFELAPEIGRAVRRVRLEGVEWAGIQNVLKATTNLGTVYLAVRTPHEVNLADLRVALEGINPARLLIEEEGLRRSYYLDTFEVMLRMCAQNWSNLRRIDLCNDQFSTTVLSSMMKDLPNLTEIHMSSTMLMPSFVWGDLSEAASNPSLKAIYCRGLTRQCVEKDIDRVKSLLSGRDVPGVALLRPANNIKDRWRSSCLGAAV